jgi:thiol:disulfide interchange protein DsbD
MSAGPIEWPHPHRLPVGPLMNYGYDGDTLLLATVEVPSNLPSGAPVTLSGKAEWLECSDVCIPGSADLSLTLPVKAAAAPSLQAPLFTQTRKLVPAAVPGLTARGTIDADRIRLALELPAGRTIDKLEFFPLEEARIEPAATQVLNRGAGVALYLTAAKPVKPRPNRWPA